MNPFLFGVGCARSGTTLLQRVLDAHATLAVVNETRWIDRFFEKQIGLDGSGRVTEALTERLLEHRRFDQLLLSRDDLDQLHRSSGRVPYATFVSRMFDLYCVRRGKLLAGDKTPRYVRSIPTLHGLWPHARFVHLIRDGRDTALSVMSWRKAHDLAQRFTSWQDDVVGTVALWWEWQVRLGLESAVSLGSDLYHEVRYEALVSNSPGECADVCGFLGIDYDDTMVRFHVGKIRTDPKLSAKDAWLPPTPALRDWRVGMGPDEIEQFEAVAGGLLAELGYEPGVDAVSSTARARAARTRQAFVADLQTRGSRLPTAWQSQ